MAKLKVQEIGPGGKVIAKLLSLKNYDDEIERKRRIWGWVWGLNLVFAIGMLILIKVVEADDPAFIFPVVFGAAFLVGLVIYIVQVGKDLDDRKLDTAIQVIQRINEDISPEAQCQIFIDFRDYRQGGTLVNKQGKWIGPKLFEYSHTWFKFAGKLYDGNKFEVGVEQDVKRKEKPKRKYTKVKESYSEKALLTLRLNPKIYPNPTQVAQMVPAGITPFGFEIKRSMGTDRALKVTMETAKALIVQGRGGKSGTLDNLMNGDRLLGLFIQTYSGIIKARPEQGVEAT